MAIFSHEPALTRAPYLLKQWPHATLWHQQDAKFEVPQAFIGLKLLTGDCGFGRTVRASVFMALWVQLIEICIPPSYSHMTKLTDFSFKMAMNGDSI